MISKETLNIDWINQVSSDNRNADKILVEKVIRALLLLEGLSESGLEFIFKGGTAVMLLQGKPKRFSIDIDIIVPSIISFEPLSIIKNTFKNFAYTEMKYRNLSKNIHSVLEDIIQTSLCLSTRGKSGLGDFEKLQKGISQLKAYIFSESYHIEKAIIHASRAAYIAKLIINDKTEIIHFKEPMQIKDWIIKNPKLTKLNKLKKSNPEAFFYWYQLNLLEVMK